MSKKGPFYVEVYSTLQPCSDQQSKQFSDTPMHAYRIIAGKDTNKIIGKLVPVLTGRAGMADSEKETALPGKPKFFFPNAL